MEPYLAINTYIAQDEGDVITFDDLKIHDGHPKS